MSNAIYKKDLHDVALAVAQGSKDYTDNSIEKLKWELGTYDLSVETVNGTTMLLPTPANTIQATMDKIYGNSEVSVNKYTANPQPMINLTAGSNKWVSLGNIPIVNGKTYTIKFFNTRVANEVVQLENYSYTTINYSTPYTFTANTDFITIRIGHGELSGDINYQLKMMIVEGSIEPTIFEPYFDNIHNLELSGLKVEGVNVLNPDNTFTYSSYTDLAYFECVGGATYTLKSFGSYTGSFGIFKYDGNSWSSIEAHTLNSGYTITAPTDAIRIGVNGVVSQSVMAVRGSVAPTTFVQYVSQTLPIDLSTILYNGSPLFEGNSLKAVGTAIDYITPYVAHKGVGSRVYQSGDEEDTSVLTDGTTTLYPLATPIEADIDLSQFVKFEAYSNGSITLVNTNNQDTTSTFKYLKEVAK